MTHTNTILILHTNAQKDLGVIITSDLKWNQHVSCMVCAKASKMLGFIKRSSMDIRNEKIRLALYKTMVRSQIAHKFGHHSLYHLSFK
jgi:hypothetical protein